MEVSIILATFNNERWLEKCLSSIRRQDFPSFECIIVDDGSTDETEKIVNQVVEADDRFKYIRIPNGGQYTARRIGIEHSTGRHITFIDGDDYIETNHISKMHELFKDGIGCVVSAYIVEYPSLQIRQNILEHSSKSTGMTSPQYLQELISGATKGFLWNKMFDRKLFESIDVQNKYGFLEDVRLLSSVLSQRAFLIRFQNIPTYHYVQRNGSSVNSRPNLKEYDALVDTLDELSKYCENPKQCESLRENISELLSFIIGKESIRTYWNHRKIIDKVKNTILQFRYADNQNVSLKSTRHAMFLTWRAISPAGLCYFICTKSIFDLKTLIKFTNWKKRRS